MLAPGVQRPSRAHRARPSAAHAIAAACLVAVLTVGLKSSAQPPLSFPRAPRAATAPRSPEPAAPSDAGLPELAAANGAPVDTPNSATTSSNGLPSNERLGEAVTSLLRELLPREFESTRRWAKTKKFVRGLDVKLDGLKLRTHRRWKTLNHGIWKRYKATLVDPQRELSLRVERLAEVSPGRLGLDLVLVARLDILARVANWNQGLRLFSLTAEADAKVRLKLALEIAAHLDPTTLPPDVVLEVEAKRAQLELLELRLRRVSDVRGEIAQQLGKIIEEFAEEELADQRGKLVDKINRKIQKNEDKLRLSLRDLIPDSLKEAAEEGDQAEQAPSQEAAREAPER